jgi:hypothetical protein
MASPQPRGSARVVGQACRLAFTPTLRNRQMDRHRIKRHDEEVFWRALHQPVLFEFADVRVDVGVVALHFVGECIHGTQTVRAQRLQQVDAGARQFREEARADLKLR